MKNFIIGISSDWNNNDKCTSHLRNATHIQVHCTPHTSSAHQQRKETKETCGVLRLCPFGATTQGTRSLAASSSAMLTLSSCLSCNETAMFEWDAVFGAEFHYQDHRQTGNKQRLNK
eukprot:TRINITY_DN63327_c0_g1_i1.p1 TRINITY_DN63327_c0_g1~~TRINITY_DN63327_c0_g1_i1.p1  ORF type:complete len:117 (+),score=2.45 TRINITY_DN63327_c0_g1_i1:428-778(+)